MRKLIKHFDFTKATELDFKYFNIAVGDKWSNAELQRYVNNPKNLFFDNALVIRSTYEDGIYSSVRINTKNKLAFTYGKIEVIAKVPKGQGTWPALWLLSQDNKYGHWPKSGEIDIMEHVGRKEDEVFLCLHSETYNHQRTEQLHTTKHIEGATNSFHKYGLDWQPDHITYYIDDREIVRYNKADKADQSHKGWPFDHNYYFIMNLAIGGKFGGDVDNSIFPVDFVIKDIKIFE